MASASYSDVEKAIYTIVQCYYSYAGDDGKKETLTLAEFTKLVNKELPHFMKDVPLEEKLKELDVNQDNEMKFSEYWKLICELSKNVKREQKKKN
ncbi:protein S100-A13 [Bombina bombina]|uniref:protein S100-A13 n=1 Tax=Bombina bombina TaxID=8345 RepID=UPI00235AA6ED|nr:protein S100-A13 [Bombina bombina]